MIKECFGKYISQPIANLYNKIMGKIGESDYAPVGSEVSADFSANQAQDDQQLSGDNDLL